MIYPATTPGSSHETTTTHHDSVNPNNLLSAQERGHDPKGRFTLAIWLDRTVFFGLCSLVVVAPHNVHIARFILFTSFALWIAGLFVSGTRPRNFSLAAPSLAFLLLTALAASFSFAPLLSWERIGWFTLLTLWIVAAHSVTNLWRAKFLIILLLASTMASAMRTGWQYLHGIGAELTTISPDTLLYRDGLRSGDIIQEVNGSPTRSPDAWEKAWRATAGSERLQLRLARGAPTEFLHVVLPRKDVQQWLNLPGNNIAPGRPVRAQGHFYHYVPYAGMLTGVSLLAFGLLLMSGDAVFGVRVTLLVTFIALVTALLATVTRTYLAALLLGCVAEFLLVRRKFRMLAIGILALSVAGATLWIQKERGYGWVAAADPGTDYRLLMWKTAGELIPQHPLLGIGPDSVIAFGDLWKIEAYEKYPLRSHFHSTYVQLAVDCGLPCLGAWLWLMTAFIVLLWRTWRLGTNSDWFTRGTLLGICGATLGFLAASFVHYNLGDGEVMIFVWLFMGMVTGLAETMRPGLTQVAELPAPALQTPNPIQDVRDSDEFITR